MQKPAPFTSRRIGINNNKVWPFPRLQGKTCLGSSRNRRRFALPQRASSLRRIKNISWGLTHSRCVAVRDQSSVTEGHLVCLDRYGSLESGQRDFRLWTAGQDATAGIRRWIPSISALQGLFSQLSYVALHNGQSHRSRSTSVEQPAWFARARYFLFCCLSIRTAL